MGCKRPFDHEDFQEVPYKQQRPLDSSNKLTSFAEEVPCNDAPQKHDISGEEQGNYNKSQCSKELEDSIVADKDVDTSTPLSWVTSFPIEEDGVFGKEANSSLCPEYFECYRQRRTLDQFEDIYSSFLNRFPRKQVPIGPDYQADIPAWDLHKMKNDSDRLELASYPQEAFSRSMSSSDDEEMFMGICVIPMPDSALPAQDHDEAGDGRKDCDCLDEGSLRCVRQHVLGAQDKLRKTLGEEMFVVLGFGDMGEEVAHKWSEEEEDIFHEVVFSNPASLGKNFWKHLSVELPSRTRRELVSYYFNVFMLWRRAAQNRSNFLDIDSDDDEWHERNVDCFDVGVMEEDEDSVIESLVDQDNQLDDEEDSSEGDDDSDDDEDSNLGGGWGNATEDDGGKDHISELNSMKSNKDCKFVPAIHHSDEILGCVGVNLESQDDSCMSFECQTNADNSGVPVETRAAIQEDGVRNTHTDCWHSDKNGSRDGAGPGYLLDPIDSKDWDAKYSAGLDLLPTYNMMEEFFGLGSWKNESKDDKGIN